MTVTAETPAGALIYLDPATLLVDGNVRLDPRLDKDFLASVKDDGVLVPVLAVRTSGGKVRVKDGQRRTLAAVKAGHTAIQVIVLGDENTTTAGAAERIFEQYTINTRRAALTAAEQAAAVATLFALEVPAETIQKRTRLSGDQVAAAQKLAASKKATAAAAKYDLDLLQGAGIAEFERDKETYNSLMQAAQRSSGELAHVLQRARDARDDQAAIAARTAELVEQGIKVSTGEGLNWEYAIHFWAGSDGKELTEKTHKDCPGKVAVLRIYGYDKTRKVHENWFCEDPKANGHKRLRSSGNGSEQSPEDRKRVLAGNKDWRSAEKVRRDFLRELLARPKLPDGGTGRSRDLVFILEAFARSDHRLIRYGMEHRMAGQHAMARELLGLGRDDKSRGWDAPSEVYEAMLKASPARAQVIALAIILGAYEAATDVQSWRNPATDTADYLEALAGWGYGLSEIEQKLVADARKKEAKDAATAARREAKTAAKQDEAAAADPDGDDDPDHFDELMPPAREEPDDEPDRDGSEPGPELDGRDGVYDHEPPF